MTVINALEVARTAGIPNYVRNEAVGTGDGNTKEFSLDYDRVIPSSEVIYVAGTAKTRTTDYTINEDRGIITFVTAPTLSAAVTADYAYVADEDLDITESDWEAFIEGAEAEANKTFNKYYSSETSINEWFDGHATAYRRDPIMDKGYVGGYEPINYADNRFILSYTPITRINHVYFIYRASELSKAYYYNGSDYTDDTTEANSVGGTAFTLLSKTTDYFYVAYDYMFEGVNFDLGTVGVKGTGSDLQAQYYNGSSWTSLTLTDYTTDLTASGEVCWTAPSDWSTTSVNSSSNYYWVRFKVATADYSTAPTAYHVYLTQDKLLSYELDMKNVVWNSNGQVFLKGYVVPDGFRNVRFNYSYGLRTSESAPILWKEFAEVVASIRLFVAIMGGSYTSVTSFNVPEMSGTIGEPYIQNRSTLEQLRLRALDILKVVSRRYVGGST